MSWNPFVEHTLESAPAGARRSMESTVRHLGHLNPGVARMADSPQLLEGFLKLSALFETCSLDPVAREVVIMTVAARNGCHVCVAMHTARLATLDAPTGLTEALRARQPLPDQRLDALRLFTLAVLDTTGAVDDHTLRAFLAEGFTSRQALEVVLAIGAYTTSTLANRLVRAPLAEHLEPYAWTEPAA